MRKFQTILFAFFLVVCGGHLFAQTADIYQKAGDSYLADKNYQAAYDSYTKAIKKTGNNNKALLSVLYYKRGESLYSMEKTDEAIKDYNSAITLNPQFVEVYWNRGVAYDAKRDFEHAAADYKKTISLIPVAGEENQLAILYCNIAFDQWMLKDMAGAMRSDSIAISLNGQYGRAYQIRGNLHMIQNKYEAAIEDFSQAMINYGDGDKKGMSILFTLRADAKMQAKKYKDAINDYSLAISMNPDNGRAYWNRGATYHLNGDYELATDDYTKAITFYKDDNVNLSRLYDNKALNEMGQTLYAKAIKDDSLAIELDSTNNIAYLDLSDAYTESADYQSAINVLNKVLGVYKGQNKMLAILHYNIANDAYFLNEFDKVVAECSKAIELDPDYSASYYYRGKVYLKKMNNKELANNDFNKVLQLDTTKKTVDYIFSLFYLGKGNEAVTILHDNLLSTTDNALMLGDYYNLACLYALMNKPVEANIYLKKAIDNGYVKKYAATDEDLDNIRNTDDYKSIMSSTPGQ